MKTEPETSVETAKCSDTPRTDFVYYEFNPAPQGVMVNALHEHAQELEKELAAALLKIQRLEVELITANKTNTTAEKI